MNPFLLLLKRIGQWFIDLGERLSDSKAQCERQGTLKIQHSAPEAATDDDQIEGLPATAPSFEIQGLTERVNSKSLEAMKVETLHLLFAMHAAHLLGSEVHQARKTRSCSGINPTPSKCFQRQNAVAQPERCHLES